MVGKEMANSQKIVRLTRHQAEDRQLSELRRIFGEEVEVVDINESMPTDRSFTTRFDELASGAIAVEAVLPLNLMEVALKFSNFCKEGGIIVRSVMNRTVDDEGQAHFTFDHYEVVKKVEVVTERL